MFTVQIIVVTGVLLLAVAGLVAMRLAMHSSRVYEGPELNPYDLALLAGGPERVADTGLAWLVLTQGFHPRRDGNIARVSGQAKRVDHPVQEEILAMLKGRSGGVPAWRIRERVASGQVVAAQVVWLRELGLIDPPRSGRADPVRPSRAGKAALAHHRLRRRESRVLPPRAGERAGRTGPDVVDVALYGLGRMKDGRLPEALALTAPKPASRRRGARGGGPEVAEATSLHLPGRFGWGGPGTASGGWDGSGSDSGSGGGDGGGGGGGGGS
ncbi:TIGR04222 domain-containing membrane protein [Streptosporangium sp. DT93]|uniref:TIGR04222 domain-containing membrane protein n=1 Tax=Streptosporangium sp. DT93 TaxID=3393428 RepID=UPI003CEC27BD